MLWGTDQPVSLEGNESMLDKKYDLVESNARFNIYVGGLCEEGLVLDECSVTIQVINSNDGSIFAEANGYSDISYSKGIRNTLKELPSCK